MKNALWGVAYFLLLTVGVFALYISGFAFYQGSGKTSQPRDSLYATLADSNAEEIFEATLRGSDKESLTSPTGKPCLLYQTQVTKWETFHSDIDDPSSTVEVKVFEETGEVFRPVLEISGKQISVDVTELDPSFLTLESGDWKQPPDFIHDQRRGFKSGFVAPEGTLYPDLEAQSTHYEVREHAFPSGGLVTAIGRPDSDGRFIAAQGKSKPILIPGSREEVLSRIEGSRNKAVIIGFKSLAVGLLSLFGLWFLRKRNRR